MTRKNPRAVLMLGAIALICVMLLAFSSMTATAGDLPTLIAQAEEQSDAASGGGGKIVISSRSYVFEVVLVSALFGLALFAICKSSNRT